MFHYVKSIKRVGTSILSVSLGVGLFFSVGFAAHAQITEAVDNQEVTTKTLKIRTNNGEIRHASAKGTIILNSKTRFNQKVFLFKPLDARKAIKNAKGAVKVADDLNVTGALSVTGLINGVDIAALQQTVDDLTIYSAGSGIEITSGSISLLSTCASGELLKWNGTTWACAADTDTTYSAGSGLQLAATTFSLLSTCTNGQLLKYDGSTWACSSDNDTTYTAGTGLSLAGTEFSSSLGTSITGSEIDANTITNADIDLTGDWTVSGAWTLSGNFVNTTNPWADNEVADALTISGGTVNNSTIGATTASTGNFTGVTINKEAFQSEARMNMPRAASNVTIDTSIPDITGQAPAMINGKNGLPIIAYYDSTSGNLIAAVCNASTGEFCSSVTESTIDSSTTVGKDPAIALSSTGLPIISYYDDFNDDLKIAFCTTGTCSSSTTATVDSTGDVGRGSAITMANNSGTLRPIISYIDITNGKLKIAQCDSESSCSSPVIQASVATTSTTSVATAITISTEDSFPLVAFIDGSQDLGLINCGTYNCSTVTSSPTVKGTVNVIDISITIGSNGLPLLAYIHDVDANGAANELNVTQCDADACTGPNTSVVISASGAAKYTSLTMGADGFPVIAYEATGLGSNLILARCSTATCTSATVITRTGYSGRVDNLDIGTSVDGLPLVAYYDQDNLTISLYKAPNKYLTPGLTIK